MDILDSETSTQLYIQLYFITLNLPGAVSFSFTVYTVCMYDTLYKTLCIYVNAYIVQPDNETTKPPVFLLTLNNQSIHVYPESK